MPTLATLERAGELDPDDYVVGDFEITALGLERLVRHENLVARVDVRAVSPTDEATEVAALLHEIGAAMLDEMVAHLPHTTG